MKCTSIEARVRWKECKNVQCEVHAPNEANLMLFNDGTLLVASSSFNYH